MHSIQLKTWGGGDSLKTQEQIALFREIIDQADREIIDSLRARFEAAKTIGSLKSANGIPVRDAAREAELLDDRMAYAQSIGLDPQLCEGVFQHLIRKSRAIQGYKEPIEGAISDVDQYKVFDQGWIS